MLFHSIRLLLVMPEQGNITINTMDEFTQRHGYKKKPGQSQGGKSAKSP